MALYGSPLVKRFIASIESQIVIQEKMGYVALISPSEDGLPQAWYALIVWDCSFYEEPLVVVGYTPPSSTMPNPDKLLNTKHPDLDTCRTTVFISMAIEEY